MSGSRSFVSARAALGTIMLVALGTLGIAAPVAAANNTTLDVGIDDCVIRGADGPMDGKVIVERWSADGTLRVRETVHSDFGWFGTDVTDDCFEYGGGVQPGDTIKTTVKGDSRTFTVPLITIRVNRDTDQATGVTQPNAKVIVWLRSTTPDTNFDRRTVRAHADGSYVLDFRKSDNIDIRGWDEVDVAWTDVRGDYVRNSNVAPGVEVTIDRPSIEAAGQAGFDATLKLLQKPGGTVIGKTGGVVYAGRNLFLWLDPVGEHVALHEGNRVVTDLAADASFTVPTLTTTINKRSDKVTVATGLGAGLAVSMHIERSNALGWANLTTDATGTVSVDFSDTENIQLFDVLAGDRLTITLRLATGDLVDKIVTVW